MNTIKNGISFRASEEEREEDGRDEGTNRQHMEEDENIEVPPIVDPNLQIPQLKWRDEETIHEEESIHLQKGTSSHGGPPAWFLEYFEKMDESLG